jgi:hypothetical protein
MMPARNRHACRAPGGDDPEERLDEGLGLLGRACRARTFALEAACTLLPEGDELAQTGKHLVLVGGVTVDFDEAENSREPPQQAEACALGFPCGVRLVTEVGVLGVGRDLVVGDGMSGQTEGFLSDLLAELVESVAHLRKTATGTPRDTTKTAGWPFATTSKAF